MGAQVQSEDDCYALEIISVLNTLPPAHSLRSLSLCFNIREDYPYAACAQQPWGTLADALIGLSSRANQRLKLNVKCIVHYANDNFRRPAVAHSLLEAGLRSLWTTPSIDFSFTTWPRLLILHQVRDMLVAPLPIQCFFDD
jgi:hypothetical protein